MSRTVERHAVIAVPVYGRLDLARAALRAIDAHTFTSVAVLVVDDAGPQRFGREDVRALLPSGRPWEFVAHEHNQGFVRTADEIFQRAGRSDVVLVNSDVEVLPGWWPALVGAAGADAQIASASSLTDNGGILSLPVLADVDPQDAAALADARTRVSPSAGIPVAVAHCTLFARAALDQAGVFDEAFSPGYGEEVDWSLRARRLGFRHVAATHSFVRHSAAGSFGSGRRALVLRYRHELLLARRYPRAFVGMRRFARNPDTELAQILRELGSTPHHRGVEHGRV